MSQAQQVSCFVSGINESLRADIQALRPSSLSTTVGLACLYEALDWPVFMKLNISLNVTLSIHKQ